MVNYNSQPNRVKKDRFSASQIVLAVILGVGILLDLLMMSAEVEGFGESVWKTASLWIVDSSYVAAICLAFVVLFLIGTTVSVVGICISLIGKQITLYPYGVGITIHVILLVMSNAFSVLGALGVMLIVLHLLLMLGGLIYAIVGIVLSPERKKRTSAKRGAGWRRPALFALGTVSTLLSMTLFYVPFCAYRLSVEEEPVEIIPLGVLSAGGATLLTLLVFVAVFVLAAVSFIGYLNSFKSYSAPEAEYADKIRSVIGMNALITGGYFVAGVAYSAMRNAKGAMFTTESYMPFLVTAVVAIGASFIMSGIEFDLDSHYIRTAKGARIEFFFYGLVAAGITVFAALSDILMVTFTKPQGIAAIHVNGLKILTTYNSQTEGFQLAAFFLLAILTVTVALFLASVVSLISKSKLFYKITMVSIISSAASSLIIGLFGKYYEVVQKMNQDAILKWIGRILPIGSVDIEYKVKSQAFYWFIGVMLVVVAVLIRKPYTRGTLSEAMISVGGLTHDPAAGGLPTAPESRPGETAPKGDSDPCPAFTELDAKLTALQRETAEAEGYAFQEPTLPGLVQFVVDYARDSRLHLSYTPEDIAAFIAGLGATRLTILQGMSGTGKTSLPKIFTEAVMGRCELVEVESSWRDKNELLGYYNEFSRTYTPKKFTQALYKAKLDPERLTFIVLDEMNLSRIEYYFSDFLSLMEHEEDRRAIKLLNVGLFRNAGGRRIAYRGLLDGHTLQIPANVWFVGTANRDESTFEISDKVYDRAHTMNFNKRAPRAIYHHEPIPARYLSAEELMRLLSEAKKNVRYDLETSALVKEVEDLLAPYNITFGNRVANQMEDFISIYCACFPPSETVVTEALETILLSKVVSKLELKSVDNKEYLASEFARLGLDRCSEFVRRLHED